MEKVNNALSEAAANVKTCHPHILSAALIMLLVLIVHEITSKFL